MRMCICRKKKCFNYERNIFLTIRKATIFIGTPAYAALRTAKETHAVSCNHVLIIDGFMASNEYYLYGRPPLSTELLHVDKILYYVNII